MLISFKKLTSLLASATLLTACALGSTITGVVTNKTNNKPSAGDDVVLIRLQQGMQESTRTKTDARGRYKLDVPDEGVHLVRVTHEKANYFQPATPGTATVNIDVYDVSAKVAGVTGEADVMRIQTEPGGSGLSVVENFFVKNESSPPMTQFSERPFEFTLPEGAVVRGSAALGPGGMPVQAAPVPLDGKNHFAFIFPIRPGETRFQVSYHLPYSGSFKFAPAPSMPTDTIAVMMPKSMKFTAGPSAPYTPVTEEATAQTYVARNVSPSQPLEFTVSGQGELPRDSQNPAAGAEAGSGAQAQGTPATDTRPGGGLGAPIDSPDAWPTKYKWFMVGGLALLLAAGAGVMMRKPAGGAGAVTAAAVPIAGGQGTLHALKEEMFALETDRIAGRVDEAQYAEQKAALEVVLRRVMARAGGGAS